MIKVFSSLEEREKELKLEIEDNIEWAIKCLKKKYINVAYSHLDKCRELQAKLEEIQELM